MMKILLKKLFRDIRTNIAQFITIILIVSIAIVMSVINYWILKEEKNERNNS